MASLHPSHTPFAFTAIVKKPYCSSVSSTMACRSVETPALLTMTSSLPKAETALPITAWTSEAFVTSQSRYSARPPLLRMTSSVSVWMSPSYPPSRADFLTSEQTTAAPSRVEADAMIRPLPELDPATTVTLPSRRFPTRLPSL